MLALLPVSSPGESYWTVEMLTTGALGPADALAGTSVIPVAARTHMARTNEFDRIGSVEVVAEHLGARRVAQLRHRLGLDLTDPLAGHAVDLADLVQGLGLAV